MTITRKNIFDKVNFYLKRENKFFASSDILSIINDDAFRRISEDLMYPKTVVSGTLASGLYQVTLPTDFIKIDENSNVTFEQNLKVADVTPKNKHDIGLAEILAAVPSTPGNYFLDNESTIGFYPPTNTTGTYVIPYVKRPTGLSSDTATNELTERCYMAAVYWTVQECFYTDSDERALKYEDLYHKEIDRLKDQYRRMLEIPRDIRPHRDYIRRPSGT